MHVSVHVYTHAYTHVHVHAHVHTHICTHVYKHVYPHVCAHVPTHVHTLRPLPVPHMAVSFVAVLGLHDWGQHCLGINADVVPSCVMTLKSAWKPPPPPVEPDDDDASEVGGANSYYVRAETKPTALRPWPTNTSHACQHSLAAMPTLRHRHRRRWCTGDRDVYGTCDRGMPCRTCVWTCVHTCDVHCRGKLSWRRF